MKLAYRLLALGSVMLAGMSSGCGGSAESALGKKVTITVSYWGTPEEMAIIHESIEPWQRAHPNLRIQLDHTPFSGYTSKILTRIAGGSAPDIVAAEANMFVSFWDKDVFLNLTPYVERDPDFRLTDFFPEVVDRFTVNGNLYAVPRDTAPYACVYYNKQLFDAAGVPYPTDDWDWGGLVGTAQQLTKRDASGRVTQFGFYGWSWHNFIYSNGGRMVNHVDRPTRCTLDEERAVEGLQFYADLMHKYHVSPTPVAVGNLGMGAQQMFMTGRVAMFSSGIWETPIFRKIRDFEWDIVLFPKGPGGHRAFGTGGTGYCILKGTKHPDEAWEVLKVLAGETGQRKLAQSGLAQPANRGIAEGPDWAGSTEPPAHKGILNAAVSSAVYDPFHPRWREIYELYIVPEFDLLFQGQETAREAVTKLVPKINELLRR